MPPRLPCPGSQSFISFYAVSRSQSTRQFSTYRGFTCRTVYASENRNRPSTSTSGVAKTRSFHSSTLTRAAAKDPYKVLGVGKDASGAEIKKVYFSLARKYHPDTNPDKNARDKFQEIQEAYDTLKDDKKRAAYDKYGTASQQPGFDADAFEQMRQNPFGGGGGFGGFGGFSGMGSTSFSGNSGDLFDTLFGAFGGGGRARESYRGDNLEASIGITFAEACKGARKTVTTTPVTDCKTCSGTGLKSGAKRSTCGSCGGSGTRTFVIDNGFQMASTCTSCNGAGTTIPRGSSCGTCQGAGKVRTRKTVEVDIPPGVDNGMMIRIPGGGDAAMAASGKPGDLLVRISVAESKVFRRQGPHIYHEARIPLHTAVLGGRVRIPTLDGPVDVRVPGGTQQGEEMVLKGRGVQSRVTGYVDQGDLLVTFYVQLPRSLTARQRELLQAYADDVEGRTPANQNASTSSDAADSQTSPMDEPRRPTSSEAPNDRENDDRADDRKEEQGPGEEQERRRATA